MLAAMCAGQGAMAVQFVVKKKKEQMINVAGALNSFLLEDVSTIPKVSCRLRTIAPYKM